MHVGFTGPRRVTYDDEGFQLQPPYRLHDNEQSILDIADIVYIDPIGVGYSRMAPGEDPHRFHGIGDDIAAMGDFIRIFTVRNGRWKSPKFLIGESYGTTRASGLAGYLQSQHQMYMNGVVLVSMTNLGYERGADMSFATVLPYMTATAWYHKKLPARPAEAAAEGRAGGQSERYAMNEYLLALIKGGLVTPEERSTVARQVARLIGVSPEFVERSNLRVDKNRFWKELLRDRELTVGGSTADTPASTPTPRGSARGRPGDAALGRPFAGRHEHLPARRAEVGDRRQVHRLGQRAAVAAGPAGARPRHASAGHDTEPLPAVLVLEGYYDGATDYYSAQYTISHVDPSGALNKRFEFAFYESGHMMYLKNSALAEAKRELARFVQSSLSPQP